MLDEKSAEVLKSKIRGLVKYTEAELDKEKISEINNYIDSKTERITLRHPLDMD